jgi:hypothetical protein
LDLARLERIKLRKRPPVQIVIAQGILRFDYALPRPTRILLEGFGDIAADRGVFLAMNHTDRCNGPVGDRLERWRRLRQDQRRGRDDPRQQGLVVAQLLGHACGLNADERRERRQRVLALPGGLLLGLQRRLPAPDRKDDDRERQPDEARGGGDLEVAMSAYPARRAANPAIGVREDQLVAQEAIEVVAQVRNRRAVRAVLSGAVAFAMITRSSRGAASAGSAPGSLPATLALAIAVGAVEEALVAITSVATS